MIEAGELVGEREALGGSRDRYRVRLDAPETPQEASGEASVSKMASESSDASAALYEASGAVTGLLAELREMRRHHAAERAADASAIADLRERVGRAEALAEQRLADKEQYVIDLGEQMERAIRAEAEVARLRARRWWRFWV